MKFFKHYSFVFIAVALLLPVSSFAYVHSNLYAQESSSFIEDCEQYGDCEEYVDEDCEQLDDCEEYSDDEWSEEEELDTDWDWLEDNEYEDDEDFELPDIENYEWADSIDFLYDNDIVSGRPSGEYDPDALLNRAEFSKMVASAAFSPAEIAAAKGGCFPDVSVNDWFGPYMCILKQAGSIQGRPDGLAHPSDTINQAEVLKIVFETFFEDEFSSEEENEAWYQIYLDEAEAQGMFYFSADNPGAHLVTRGEMAYFISWLLDEEAVDQIDPSEFSNDYKYEDDFGWGEMTANDCYEDEYFDEEDNACYVLCDGDECAEEDADFDYEEYNDLFDDVAEGESAYEDEGTGAEGAADEVVIYSVKDGVITLKNKQNAGNDRGFSDTALHQAIWNRFSELIPASYHNEFITEFHVFTDGPDEIMAYVDSVDGNNWAVAIDFNDAGSIENLKKNKQLSLTLVHEFAHILSLNTHQIQWNVPKSDCKLHYAVDEGCTEANSYLNLFFKKFWGGSLIQKHAELMKKMSEFEVAARLFSEDQFITEYAATNPIEDLAESFAYMVINPEPTGNKIADQKLTFLYDFPELVNLRKAIRFSL